MKAKLLIASVVILALAALLAGYTQSVQGSPIRWAANAQVRVMMNSAFEPGHPAELTRGALQSVLRTWNAALAAQGIGVRYVDGGVTAVNVADCDGINLITFTERSLPPGVLAVAITTTAPAPGNYTCGSTTITATFAGEILDADMSFNRDVQFATNHLLVGGEPLADVEAVGLHEAGHMLGLGHSGISTAVMVAASAGDFPIRRPQPDDIAGINAIYGTNAPGGTISGRVTDGSGAGVLGAHVVATNATTGQTSVSVLTAADGRYTMSGLQAPATYRLWVEPLDFPWQPGNMPSEVFANAVTDFATAFRQNPVSVTSAAPVTGIDFSVGGKTMNLQSLINVPQGDTGFGGAVSSAKRGVLYTIFADGTGLSGELTLSAPVAAATPAGNTSGGGTRLQRSFNLATTAAPGFYDVYAPAAGLAGSFHLTVNPNVPSNGVVEGAAFGSGFAPGSIISIFGTDLAETTAFADALPLPTQMGGAAVEINGRWVPLYYVSPTQINAMVPFEVSGTVPVRVQTGGNSYSRAVNINLVAAAPRIFVTGGTQGAIQNGSRNNVLVDAANPASAGDVVVIFCEGLGVTSPAVVSGVASPAVQVPGAVSVTIGGQPASVQYKGLSPNFVGLYQVNAQVPAGVSGVVNVQISAGGNQSNVVTMVVR
jgi:uncharacterized protein (TIGR03437 family)